MVSIIVPIYNVERYLARCLDSLLAQTNGEWEAILVDDGSPDGSASIAERYVQRDSRFHLVRRPNGGLSAARNTGMEHARGKYLLFVDSDDFLHPQTVELTTQAAKRDGSELVAFTYDRTYRTRNIVRHVLGLGDGRPHYRNYKDPEYIVTERLIDYATEYTRPTDIPRRWAVKHCQVVRCLYRRELATSIPFIEGILYEDFPWWSEMLLRARRCTIINLPLYFYYPNPRSIIFASANERKAEGLRRGIEAAERLYATADPEVRALWEKRFLQPFKRKLQSKTR